MKQFQVNNPTKNCVPNIITCTEHAFSSLQNNKIKRVEGPIMSELLWARAVTQNGYEGIWWWGETQSIIDGREIEQKMGKKMAGKKHNTKFTVECGRKERQNRIWKKKKYENGEGRKRKWTKKNGQKMKLIRMWTENYGRRSESFLCKSSADWLTPHLSYLVVTCIITLSFFNSD